jgi:hypothetical protein
MIDYNKIKRGEEILNTSASSNSLEKHNQSPSNNQDLLPR